MRGRVYRARQVHRTLGLTLTVECGLLGANMMGSATFTEYECTLSLYNKIKHSNKMKQVQDLNFEPHIKSVLNISLTELPTLTSDEQTHL